MVHHQYNIAVREHLEWRSREAEDRDDEMRCGTGERWRILGEDNSWKIKVISINICY